MRIKVGDVCMAKPTRPGALDGLVFRVDVLAQVEREGQRYFLGMIARGDEGIGSARLFSIDGVQCDPEQTDISLTIYAKAEDVRQWHIVDAAMPTAKG